MPATILLADDDRDFLIALDRKLQQEGFLTACATNLAEARRLLVELGPHVRLLILDKGLCALEEPGFVSSLRSQHPDVRTILMTADPDAASYLSAYQAGVFEYLSKPQAFDEIASIVRRALGGKHAKSHVP